MQIFVTGTDTDIGKTIVSSWLCLHTESAYFKPIQTGSQAITDSQLVNKLAKCHVYPEVYVYKHPVAPYLAAQIENDVIDLNKIKLPINNKLIVEGAGGIFVPLNSAQMIIDLIQLLDLPVIIVASSRLGTINHTLLTLEALHKRSIHVLGVIVNGPVNKDNSTAIKYYGNTNILAEFPEFSAINREILQKHKLTKELAQIIEVKI